MNARDRGVSTEARTALDAEGPLRRWARRRREVAREEQAAAEVRRGEAPPEGPREPLHESFHELPGVRDSDDGASGPAAEAEKVPSDEDMPPLDSLDEDSDYSGFLSPGVSEALRRRALRKLFMSAVFNIPDGLDDYDDDFTSFQALGDVVTSDMRHQAEMEAERAKQARADAEPASGHRDEPSRGEDAIRGEDERLAPADGEARAAEEEGPAGTAAPAEPPVAAGSEPPEDVASEEGALDPVTGEGAADEPEFSDSRDATGRDSPPDATAGVRAAAGPGAADGASARSSAGEPAAGSEEASRASRDADGGMLDSPAGELVSTGAGTPGDPGPSGLG